MEVQNHNISKYGPNVDFEILHNYFRIFQYLLSKDLT